VGRCGGASVVGCRFGISDLRCQRWWEMGLTGESLGGAINRKVKKMNRMLAAAVCCGMAAPLAFIAPVVFTPGCATDSSGKKVIDVQKASDLAPALAATVSAAVIYGQSRDANTVTYAGAVKTALQEFILSTNLSPANLQAAITALPYPELKKAEAQLLMLPVFTAYKVFVEQRAKAGLQGNEGLKVLVQAMIDGIQAGQDAVKAGQINVGLMMDMQRAAGSIVQMDAPHQEKKAITHPIDVVTVLFGRQEVAKGRRASL